MAIDPGRPVEDMDRERVRHGDPLRGRRQVAGQVVPLLGGWIVAEEEGGEGEGIGDADATGAEGADLLAGLLAV